MYFYKASSVSSRCWAKAMTLFCVDSSLPVYSLYVVLDWFSRSCDYI